MAIEYVCLVSLLKTSRLEYGLHPFFYCIKDNLHNLILLAKELDTSVHYTPGKMSRIKGSKPKIKIIIMNDNPKIIFLKLYGQKIVQSFFVEFSSYRMADLFYIKALTTFKDDLII